MFLAEEIFLINFHFYAIQTFLYFLPINILSKRMYCGQS